MNPNERNYCSGKHPPHVCCLWRHNILYGSVKMRRRTTKGEIIWKSDEAWGESITWRPQAAQGRPYNMGIAMEDLIKSNIPAFLWHGEGLQHRLGTIVVNSLADSGPEHLREACETCVRIVVFNVFGALSG